MLIFGFSILIKLISILLVSHLLLLSLTTIKYFVSLGVKYSFVFFFPLGSKHPDFSKLISAV